MRYKLLGRSGLRVSEVALGAMTFTDRGMSWGATPEDAKAMFDLFAEAGGTFIDTANIYGDDVGGQEGASERVLSDLLAADREHFVVATKYTSSNTEDISRSGNSLKSMRQSVDDSLRALRCDYIDLLWLHTWDATTPVDEVLRGADQLITAGKVLYFAFSDTPAWVVSYAAAMAEARGWARPVAIQVEYSLAQRTPERDLLPMAQSLDLAVLAWSPLAGGVLSGKYRGGAASAQTHRLADAAFEFFEKPGGDTTEQIADEVVTIAGELDLPPAQVALAWLLQRPGVVIPILGARRPEQLRQNLDSIELQLDSEHLRRLDEVSAPSLGFPHEFLASPNVRRFSVSGFFDRLDNHHPFGAAAT
jgi:aryl-alcohol dehydrogenase-like predicted oxidoreductase